MPEPLPKVGVLLACLWHMHKLQIHKLVSRCDHWNVSKMYSVFWRTKCFGKGTGTVYAIAAVYAVVEIKWVFSDSTEISASEEPNALEKAPVQFISLWKLSKKFHFLVWFYMSNWNGTYICHGTFRNSRPLADLNALGPGYEVRLNLVTTP